MTRSEIAKLAEPEGFQPFVIVTSGAKNAKKGPRMDAKGDKPFNRRWRYVAMRFALASGMSHDEIL
jgi:hypothetical protein